MTATACASTVTTEEMLLALEVLQSDSVSVPDVSVAAGLAPADAAAQLAGLAARGVVRRVTCPGPGWLVLPRGRLRAVAAAAADPVRYVRVRDGIGEHLLRGAGAAARRLAPDRPRLGAYLPGTVPPSGRVYDTDTDEAALGWFAGVWLHLRRWVGRAVLEGQWALAAELVDACQPAWKRMQPDGSVAFFAHGVTAVQVIGRPGLSAQALVNLSDAARADGELATALRAGFGAAELSAAIGDRRGLAAAKLALSRGYLAHGEHSQAAEHLREALRLAEEGADHRTVHAVLLALADLALRTGKVGAARTLCFQADQVDTFTAGPVDNARRSLAWARYHLASGNPTEALDRLTRHAPGLGGIDPVGSAALHRVLAEAYRALGDGGRAGQCVEYAADLLMRAGRHGEAAELRTYRGAGSDTAQPSRP